MASDYATSTLVKEALSAESINATDDAYLAKLVTRASRHIDQHCNRTFVAEADTRKYHAVDDVDGDDLFLDADLVSVTTLTNGDGTEITAAKYVLLPTNFTPKSIIRLRSDSSAFWTWTTDPNEAISVEGMWGFSSNTPDDIIQATIDIAVWWYKTRKNPFTEVGTQQGGIAVVSPGMPEKVVDLLNPYIREEF